MRVLLVQPLFPMTYWGFQHALPLAGKKAALPPLGLISLAALLPAEWDLRLVDLNYQPLRQEDLEWADAVFTGGMRVQSESMHAVLMRARQAGKRTAVGGPAPSTAPEEFDDADIVFCGEAEGRIDSLVEALEGTGRVTLSAPLGSFPQMHDVPVPRYDLVDLNAYASMSLQYSRGCPFQCEFCDIIEIYGRRPRTKTTDQVLAEVSALYNSGYRGSVFFVDDNFIGNRPAVRELLPTLIRFQEARGYPFEFYTEASVNLAGDKALIRQMVDAGFCAVFLGIETPSPEALKAAKKNQNLAVDLSEAVETLARAGLEVMGGFIVGLDQDTPESLLLQHEFLEHTPIPLAMIGLLTALPGTALWRRLEKEGRLRHMASGDQFMRPNFEPAMDEEQLLTGYAWLLSKIYSADEYYDRCEAFLQFAPPLPGRRKLLMEEIPILFRTMREIGTKSPRRARYWRLLRKAATEAPHAFPWAVAQAIKGEHMIRYTEEEVLPRIHAALREINPQAVPPSAEASRDHDLLERTLRQVREGIRWLGSWWIPRLGPA